ncbi:MAG: SDR family oxidoreductase [Candidatus Omnitrophica bacterium]|jgi:nucleoside-diphosphate-sugar epimerase|nr:SDR family oxidoreductase [Candidatus Omnitrophota bacterium]MDD5079014.1 SDR family oxidoreductase [Candidatus Omnitrophota bacterium]
MRFLVTGGAGFIGSHITEKLLKDGHFVRVLDNFSSGKQQNLSFAQGLPDSKFQLIQGDIRDKSMCEKVCLDIDAVLHQAALRSVPKSLKDPASYNEVNINGTLYMLQAASKNRVKRFAMASSSSVYGDVDTFPEKEDFLPKLISPYALSKLAGEYYCRIFSEHYGLETVALRYFNVFGPRQALDDEYAVVIPKFINCIMRDKQPPIFGTGKQSRDFTYIDNVVQANILAATAGKIKHEVLNVAAGKDTTVLQLVDMINEILGKQVKPELLAVRAGDVFRTNADISRIARILDFKPAVSFNEGLKKTVDWWQKQPR